MVGGDDEDYSPAQGSDQSAPSKNTPSTTASKQPLTPSKLKKAGIGAVQHESPRRRRTSSFTNPELELIMPSIHEEQVEPIRTEVRKRRSLTQQPQPTITSTNRPKGRKRESESPERLSAVFEKTEQVINPISMWLYDVLGGALTKVKTPISYLIAIYLLFGLMIFARNMLTISMYSAMSPICRLPGSSLLNLEFCKTAELVKYNGEEIPPVRFDQLMRTQSKFEEILEQTAEGITLPADMKRSEASIRDLRQVVRYSSINSKHELVLEFDGFIDTAKIASYDLQRFGSHVGGSVDKILSNARIMERNIQGIAEKDAGRGAIAAFLTDKVLAPFQPIKFAEDSLTDEYIQHTRAVEIEIHRLIEEAQALLLVLNNLEDRLDVIHGICVQDDQKAQYSKEEILSQLWTKLGGNRAKIGKFDSELRLLRDVNSYRESAFGYVAGTILKLQEMEIELEAMRQRVGDVELLRDKANIPLSVHIENIRLGVERLEIGRSKTMKQQGENMMKRLDRGDDLTDMKKEPPRMIDTTRW